MGENVRLKTELVDDEIVVTLPGTNFMMSFRKLSDAPWLDPTSYYVS